MIRRSRFGYLLVMTRLNRQLRQKEVALSAGIDASYLAGIENGRRAVPQARTLSKILDSLNLSLGERKTLEDAAAWEQITSMLERSESHIPAARALTQLSMLLPTITDAEAESMASLFEVRNHINDKTSQ